MTGGIPPFNEDDERTLPPPVAELKAKIRVAAASASMGVLGTARAQYHLRQTFIFLNMYPVNRPEVMISTAAQRVDAQGHLTDETSRRLIGQLLVSLVAWTRRLRASA